MRLTMLVAIAGPLASPRSDSRRRHSASSPRSAWSWRISCALAFSSASTAACPAWLSRALGMEGRLSRALGVEGRACRAAGFELLQRLERRQLRHQVVMHRTLGAYRVALLDGIDQHAVLVDRRVDAPGQRKLAAAPQPHELAQVAGHAIEPAVVGQRLHAAVELVVGVVVAVDVVRGGVALELVVQALALGDVVVAGLAH